MMFAERAAVTTAAQRPARTIQPWSAETDSAARTDVAPLNRLNQGVDDSVAKLCTLMGRRFACRTGHLTEHGRARPYTLAHAIAEAPCLTHASLSVAHVESTLLARSKSAGEGRGPEGRQQPEVGGG